jgi:flagellar basal-body rod protein FlgG
MIRGVYTAASGLLANLRRQEAVSNNLANANTVGYKEDAGADSAFARVLASRVGNEPLPVPLTFQKQLGTVGTGAYQSERRAFLRQGTLRPTGEQLDLALVGPGFFAVQTPGAGTFYTRDGHFTTNDAGEVISADGRTVLDTNGQPINAGGGPVTVLRNGEVVVDGQAVATIAVYDIPAEALVRAEGSAFTATRATLVPAGAEPRIEQGQLEESNTDLAEEATRLMNTSRQFGASQQVFRQLAANLEQAVTEIGRVA